MADKVKKQVLYLFLSVLIGAVIGVVEAGFWWGLVAVGNIRETNIYLFIPFLALGGLVIVYFFKNHGKDISAGIGMMFDAWHNDKAKIPLKCIPFMIGSTYITHIFGGSSGREGVAVQIGASIAHSAGRKLPYDDAPRILMIAGMAAGFAGIFRTPLTGIAFAMEVLIIGELRYEGIFPAVVAAYASDAMSGILGVVRESFDITSKVTEGDVETMVATLPDVLKLLVLGIAFGLCGAIFAHLLKISHKGLEKLMPNPYIRIAVCGIIISVVMLLFQGRYSGGGGNLLDETYGGGNIYWYDFILKLLLTVLTLAAGFKGGEVMPLFTIGSLLGFVLGPLLGLSPVISAALGFAAVFGSGTGTLIAPVLVGGEIFGWGYTPLFIAVCLTARIVNEGYTIYSGQKRAYIKDV